MWRQPSPITLWCGSFTLLALVARSMAADPTEDKYLALLRSGAPVAEERAACFELRRVGTVRSVPVLAKFLTDPQVSHAARDALTSMPYPEAGAALRDALPRAHGAIRIGLIASLGARRDKMATGVLVTLLSDTDGQVVSAAAAALGEIATPEASLALVAALSQANAQRRGLLSEGCLRCARHLAGGGNTARADALYRLLTLPEQDRHVRRAAHLGLLQLAGHNKLSMIIEFLSNGDPEARASAASQLDALSEGDFCSVAGSFGKLSPAGQEAVLAAAALRDCHAVLPVVVQAARSSGPAQSAAVAALGRLGDESVLPDLLQALFAGSETHDAARRSLEMLRGRGIDERLIAAMHKEQAPDRRGELIDVLGGRAAGAAVPALLAEANGENAAVRLRAMSALAHVARPTDVPSLLRCLYRSARGPERDNAEQAILTVCETIPAAERRADPILAELKKASAAEKAVALPLLGRTGAPGALKAIQSALASKNPEVYTGGVRALANWPRPEVADQLLGLAEGTSNPEHRSWAVVGLARAVTAPGTIPPARRLEMLRQAMALAQRGEDRRAVLEKAALVHTVGSLRFALPYLDQPALSEQACRTVVALAHQRSLRLPNQQEFDRALQKVIQTSKEAGTVDRARKYLAGL
jgi:HEAT repeat protein